MRSRGRGYSLLLYYCSLSLPLSSLLLLTVVGRVDHGRVEDAVDVEHARGLFFFFLVGEKEEAEVERGSFF